MRTLIAVPCMDSVPAHFAQSLVMMDKVGEVALAMQMGSLVYDSRNALAREAINRGTDYVLWLDSDMVFAPDLLTRLFATAEATGADILTGVYYRRQPPYTPVLYDRLDWDGDKIIAEKTEDVGADVHEVAGCGFGCVLMRSDVLLGTLAATGAWFSPYRGIGEDLAFCMRAREAGYKILCDPSITLGHVGNTIITKQFFDAYTAGKGKQ